MSTSGKVGAGSTTQFRLLSLVLIVSTIAVWLAWYRAREDLAVLKAELPELLSAARELVVTDTQQYAVVSKHPAWLDEDEWEVYLPEGREYKLSLQLEDIPRQDRSKPWHDLSVLNSVPRAGVYELPAGIRRISCRLESSQTGYRVAVSCDGKPVIQCKREHDWIDSGSVSTAGINAISRSQVTGKSLLLSMKRFAGHGKAPHELELVNGILLWIDEKR